MQDIFACLLNTNFYDTQKALYKYVVFFTIVLNFFRLRFSSFFQYLFFSFFFHPENLEQFYETCAKTCHLQVTWGKAVKNIHPKVTHVLIDEVS